MSPSDLRTAEEKLYIRLNGCPKNIILMYNMDFSITSGGVSILSRRKGERKKPIIERPMPEMTERDMAVCMALSTPS